MRKIIIANRKGGTAKSTTAVHLAAGLAKIKKRVLLIDTDSQGNCAKMLGVSPTSGLAELIADAMARISPGPEVRPPAGRAKPGR